MTKKIKTIADLTPDAANLNKGTERGRYLLETSVSKLGLGRSVLADKNGTLIAGNKTTEVAGELGMSKVRVIETENMPGGNAVKPGDVLRARNGKTIEVLNTDAEGRLILADALSYAGEQNLDEVFDIATLTGACVIALGKQIVGLMGNDAAFLDRVRDASIKAGEKVWELPLEKEYEPLLKSPVADLKNIGPVGEAGTILAGLFLKEFVAKDLPWAHLDIASTGWTSGPTALSDTGSTGVMVRTLLHYFTSHN
jgi:leucyl aminopeptidase